MEFRVLGPLEVRADDGRPLAITRPRQRALLCVLLLHASQPVPAGQLIDLLWDSAPPRTASGALRTHVWGVRRLLGAGGDRLRTLPAAYQLQVAPDELDLLAFTRLSSEGRRALAGGDFDTAAERLDRALRLWRGAPLTDLPATPALSAEVARLEEERLAAREALLEARLALGRHHEVAGEIRALVTAHPLRERLWALLITALYRAGRQADALAAYTQVREVLVREIGVEPGAELQRLQRRVLAADPTLDAPETTATGTPPRPAAPRQLPADIATFTGRTGELKRLGALLGAPDEPAGPVVISAIDGMGGIGKSALAIHAAHRLADRFPDGQLYLDLQGSTPGLAPLEPLEALGRMLRALGLGPDAIPRGLEEAAGRFRSLAAERRLLVLLDNAHGAEQVRPLLPASPGCGVVITSRRVLATLEGAHSLHLDVLPRDKALELLSRLAGPARVEAEPRAAAEVVEACGYLPLAIRIAGARLAARPTWPIGELAGRLADATQRLEELAAGELELRASFEVSLRTLRESPHPADRAAAQAFGLLSLPDGADLEVAAAASLLDRPELAARRLLERLVDAQLLETPRPGRYRFHDLLRLYAREHAGVHHPQSERLAALRRLFGFYTATAWQTLRLLRPGDWRLAAADPSWTAGGRQFPDIRSALAWLESERANLLAAIAQIGGIAPGVPAELACQLTLALYGFFLIRNYWADGVRANQTALELARRDGDRAAQARASNDLGSVSLWLGRYQEALAYEQESIALFRELGDRSGHAASLTGLGTVHWRMGRYEEALACHQDGLSLFRQLGDRRGQAISLDNLGRTCEKLGRYQEALAYEQESIALFRELGDRSAHAISLGNLGLIYERLGRYGDALACQRECLTVYRETGDRQGQAYSLTDLGRVYEGLGRHEQALACHRQSLTIFAEIGDRHGQAEVLRDLGDALLRLGRTGQAREVWLEALAIYEALKVPAADEIRARLAG